MAGCRDLPDGDVAGPAAGGSAGALPPGEGRAAGAGPDRAAAGCRGGDVRAAVHPGHRRPASTESIGKLEELIVPGAPAAPADAEGREAGEDGTGPEPGPGEEARAGSAGGGRAFLQELKEDPGPLTLETLLAEIGKLERVKALKLPDGLFEGVSEKIVAGWRARAMKMYPSDFAGAPDPVRLTLLAALCHVRRPRWSTGWWSC